MEIATGSVPSFVIKIAFSTTYISGTVHNQVDFFFNKNVLPFT